MSKHNVVEFPGRDTIRDELTELIRDGARKLISEAPESEVSELLSEARFRQIFFVAIFVLGAYIIAKSVLGVLM